MATFLDISLLGHFVGVFTFLLVFVIVFGMLEMFKAFGDGRKGLHAIIALAMGFLVIFSKGMVAIITTFTPWMTFVVLVIFFILFAVRMFGVSTKEINAGFHNYQAITIWILVITGIILLFSLGAGLGQQSLESTQGKSNVSAAEADYLNTNTGDFGTNLSHTLFHPKVLGLILILLIVLVGSWLLTGSDA